MIRTIWLIDIDLDIRAIKAVESNNQSGWHNVCFVDDFMVNCNCYENLAFIN
jgi:hypothetical protein